MGAAFPFSIGKRIERGESQPRLVWDAVLRGLQLTFFAIFIEHFYPYVLSSPKDPRSWGLALLAFVLLFSYVHAYPVENACMGHSVIKLSAYALAFLLMTTVQYAGGRTWSLNSSNIIILLLANMAVFGSIVYIFTKKIVGRGLPYLFV